MLLLQQLQKHTPQEHPDVEYLKEAVNLMSKLASDINTSIQEQENFEKIFAIQESFVKGQIHVTQFL